MKKVFLLLAIVALSLSASAQKFSLIFDGQTYSDGQTLVIDRADQLGRDSDPNFEAVIDPLVKNISDASVRYQVRVDKIDANAQAFDLGICVGSCVTGGLSLPGQLAPSQEEEVPIHLIHFGEHTQGLFLINVYDTENEGDTLKVYLDFTLPTDGIAQASEARVVAYPNPSHGQVTIESQTEGTVVVRDLLGRTVARANGSLSLTLPQGIYTYALEGQKARKLIVR